MRKKKNIEENPDEERSGVEVWYWNNEYEEVEDEDGFPVICEYCGANIMWKDGAYICPHCGNEMDREDFFNYIGATPPGPECVHCNSLYPGCMFCIYGYVK